MKGALHLLDGYSLIYRSYFAFIRQPLRNPRGQNASAVFGFFRTLLSLFAERKPEYFAVAMDSRRPTFRHELYPEYKATRQKTPEDLRAQVPIIEEMLEAARVPVLRFDGFEADDLMATLAERCRREGRPCFVITGDKDLLQLVDGPVRILRPEKGGLVEMGPNEVREAWGVEPRQILDYLTLVGDGSDNVPGVKGIGEKTAVALLNDFGSLDAVFAGLDRVSSASWRAKLEAGRESAALSRRLISLRTDVALPDDISILSLSSFSPTALIPFLKNQGIRSIADEIERAPGGETGAAGAGKPAPAAPALADASAANETTAADASYAAGRYRTVHTVAELAAWVDRALGAGEAAFDTETSGLDPLRSRLVGFSIAVEEGEACYVPVEAPGGEGLELEAVVPELRRLLEDPGVRVIGQNIKFDYKVLRSVGVRMTKIYFDTMLAAWLLDADQSTLNMDRLAEALLDYRTLHFDDVVPKGGTFDQVALERATAYAAEDADVALKLYGKLKPRLADRGMEKLFHEVEMPLVAVLGEMELAGVALAPGVLEAYGVELEKDLAAIEVEIFRLCGREFNINSTRQLQEVLFEVRGLKPIKKTQTGYSTDTSVLEELAAEDPVPELVLKHRMLGKLKSTYVDTLPNLVNPKTGRIHTNYHQTGTATGRLSSKDPNLQNIPIKEEAGRRIRAAFVPAPGYRFLSADYAQIELVVLAQLSSDPGLRAAFAEGQDIHRRTAALIFGCPEGEVTPDQRRAAKTINFGVMYGMSAFRLSRELRIPRADADRFIKSYFETYAGVRAFIDATVAGAEATGRVRTLLGRERPIPTINSKNKTEKAAAERVAVNTPIQGTAADLVKVAMLRVTSAIVSAGLRSRLLLQVHDELIFEVPEDEVTRMRDLVRREMEAALPMNVPPRASVEVGQSWGELH